MLVSPALIVSSLGAVSLLISVGAVLILSFFTLVRIAVSSLRALILILLCLAVVVVSQK